MKTFVVMRHPGKKWRAGVPTREQPLWLMHAHFMDGLFRDGIVVMAGPLADESGNAVLVCEADDAESLSRAFDADPWTENDVLGVGEIMEWTLFFDARTK
jgi:uncharacterized protein YciI